MNTRRFVSGSSILLAGWLGATFLNDVPSQRYPKLDKEPATAAADQESNPALIATQVKSAVLPDSFSR
ncbi:MAG: hypothetical protein V4819_00030 [Verrucomicrobiota bacterium]